MFLLTALAHPVMAQSLHWNRDILEDPVESSTNPAISDSSTLAEGKIYSIVDTMPDFPGGEDSLAAFLKAHLEYPDSAICGTMQNETLLVNCIVYADGSVGHCSIERGMGPACDSAALQVLRQMPDWKPGSKNGKPVNVYVTIPILFEPDPGSAEKIYAHVSEMPEFPGGKKGLSKYLDHNLKYPAEARNEHVQGTVYVGFVVLPDGSVSKPEIVQGIRRDCDEEALRVVRNMPAWKPGRENGETVSVYMTIPVTFHLGN